MPKDGIKVLADCEDSDFLRGREDEEPVERESGFDPLPRRTLVGQRLDTFGSGYQLIRDVNEDGEDVIRRVAISR